MPHGTLNPPKLQKRKQFCDILSPLIGDLLWDLELEAHGPLCGLTLGNGASKREEGSTAEVDRHVDGVHECQALEVWKAIEDVAPVVSRADFKQVALEDVAQLGGVDRRHDQQVLAEIADALKAGNDMVSVDAVDFVVDHDILEKLLVGDGLRAVEERDEVVDGLGGEREVDVAIVGDLGPDKECVQLKPVCKCGAANHGSSRGEDTVWAEERSLWRQTAAAIKDGLFSICHPWHFCHLLGVLEAAIEAASDHRTCTRPDGKRQRLGT